MKDLCLKKEAVAALSEDEMTGRERVKALLDGKQIDRLPLMPITMQFACNLIGKDYHDYVTDHEVPVEAQIRTAERFGFDHVSVISDPTREATDLGAKVIFGKGAVPCVDQDNSLLADKTKLSSLKLPSPYNPGRMNDRVKAIESFKKKVGAKKYIEGWVEGPCAEAADVRGINTIMMDFIDDPQFVCDLMDFTNELAWSFAQAQIEAGADIIGVGDAVCSLLGPSIYKDYIWEREKNLIDKIHQNGAAVRLHICGNITDLLEDVALLNCEVIDIDFPVPLNVVRSKVGDKQLVAGNMHPVAVVRDGSPESIMNELKKCHSYAGNNYVIAAGCEVVCDTDYQNVETLLEYSRSNRFSSVFPQKSANKNKIIEIVEKRAEKTFDRVVV